MALRTTTVHDMLSHSSPCPAPPFFLHIFRYNESFEFDVSNPASLLSLECWEEDTFSNTYVGGATIAISDLSNGKKVGLYFFGNQRGT